MNPALVAVIVVVVAAFLFFAIAKVVGARRRQVFIERRETLISVVPKTSLGKWSVGLAIALILFLVLVGTLTAGFTFSPGFNPVLAVVLKITLVGIPGAVFVTGLISMLKCKERSIIVLVIIALGFWFLIGGVWHLLGGE